jgi:hypothetical protein
VGLRDGVLSNQYKIAPNGGRGYGPRHLDFHPTKPWMYVSIETQNQMHMHRMQGGKPLQEVVFNKTTLLEPNNIRSRQAASTLHVHPNGRFLYGANRSQDLVDFNGRRVYKGGENSIVVYALNPQTGEPTAIQHIETQKLHPRTFHIDPSGRLLVAQHNLPVNVREGRRGAHREGGAVGLPHAAGRQALFRAHVQLRRRQEHQLGGWAWWRCNGQAGGASALGEVSARLRELGALCVGRSS